MDIRQLNAFRVVSQTGSITKAAAILGYSQSAVTSQIKKLEAVVRAPLFERRREGVRLTPGGERFLPYVTRLLRLSDEAMSVLAPKASLVGRMTIGASESITTYRLPDVIRHFHSAHPDVRLTLRTFHEGPAHMAEALARGDIDVAVTHCVDPGPEGAQSKRLATEPLTLVATPEHPLAERDVVTSADLCGTRTLIVQATCVYDVALRTALPADRTVAPFQFGTIEAVKIAARSGQGVALLPKVAVTDQLLAGELVELCWASPVTVSSYALWGENWEESRLLTALDAQLDRVAGEWHRPDRGPHGGIVPRIPSPSTGSRYPGLVSG
ncbi:DNA-binding transcriptional LysR family regulator [Umezawaea tangerina]|uniref:DNA-binding transcriptional LysR family regulator n=1 Tax=Umezawaea tangerina TaxID=84725 RepID=A0A2T0TG65_9PSEU|nr:DNA-binding transcriptional LysR family regulator [Umezawaea tangerina]